MKDMHYAIVEARLFDTTTLVRPVLLWPFLALPILLLVCFGADLFGSNFTKIFFISFFLFSILLIYKKNIFCFSFSVFNKFLSTPHKKYKFKHTATVYLFGYSSNR